MKKEIICRWVIYSAGLMILALGIILNTKAGLGVSPIISVSYCASSILSINFADATLILYCMFVVVEVILHMIKGHGKSVIVLDVLQIPLSIVFTRFMNLFSGRIPSFATECEGHFFGTISGRLIILAAAIVLTGVGAAMSLNMRIIPNPGDGIVQVIADCIGKNVGFTKNCFDLFCVLLTILMSFLFAGHLIGIGIGTVMAVIGVGRAIAVFNYFTMDKLLQAAGIKKE